jgi:hypothetical protein
MANTGTYLALGALGAVAVVGTYFIVKSSAASQLNFQAEMPDGTLSTSPVYSVGQPIVFVYTLPDTLAQQAYTVQWFSNNPSITGLVHSWNYSLTGDSYFDDVGTASSSMVSETPLQIYAIVTLTSGQTIKSNTITFTVTG